LRRAALVAVQASNLPAKIRGLLTALLKERRDDVAHGAHLPLAGSARKCRENCPRNDIMRIAAFAACPF